MINYNTIIRANRIDKKGLAMIYFIIQKNWISTKLKIEPKYFDSFNGTIKKSYGKYFIISPQLQHLKSRCEQFLSQINIANQPFVVSQFDAFVFRQTDSNETMEKLIKEYCNKNNISWGRAKHYFVLSNQLNAFKHNCKILDIDFKFCNSFQQHLRSIGNNEMTIHSKIKALKAIVHYAQNIGLLQSDPLKQIKLSEPKSNRVYLTVAELQQYQDYYNSTKNVAQKNVLQYFLFSCYTGIRYGDVLKLQRKDVTSEAMHIVQEKTKKPILVPLIDKAKALIDYTKKDKLFNVVTNQKSNENLKNITAAVGIEKNITYHCSRHTFATLSIYYGIPQEVVAEILGVNDKVVKVYAKIMEQVKFREMAKWGRTQQSS